MHKVRENNNGTFSIGKTWVLDDLTAIQSYTNLVTNGPEEQQAKERAGGIGFVVTIQKPYYWQASTPKEKDFFIFSLIKIYKKYTAGKLPQLHGFEVSELEQLGGGSLGSPAPPSRPSPRAPNVPGVPRAPGAGINSGTPSPNPSTLGGERLLTTPQLNQNRETSRGPREGPSQERPFIPNGDLRSRPSQEHQNRSGSETRSRPSQESSLRNESDTQSRPSQERVLRSTDSDDRIPHVPGQFPSSDFVRNLKPQNSQNRINGQRSDSPSGSSFGGESAQPQPHLRKTAGAQSTDSFRNTSESQSSRYLPSQRPSEERIRPNGAFTASSRSGSSELQRPSTSGNSRAPSNFSNGSAPEAIARDQAAPYQRPPTSAPLFNQNQKVHGNGVKQIHPSILSPGFRGNDTQRPVQTISQADEKNGRELGSSRSEKDSQTSLVNGSRTQHSAEQSQQLQNGSSLPVTAVETPTTRETPPMATPPPSTPEPQPEAEPHRPGLGPMIKAKKSNKEIAATFRKAATSYNAFKPRAGGAAERLQNAKEKEGLGNEPDGITGVVPAPSLLRGASQDQVKSPNLDQIESERSLAATPPLLTHQPQALELFEPPSQSLSPNKTRETPIVKISTPPTKRPNSIEAPRVEADKPPPTPEKDERRRKRKSDHSAKYAKDLGIHPSLLEGRTFEIESVLNDFGWGEESTERNAFEELQSGIRKELAHVEAGSWLGAIENHDERVAAVGEMMDRVVAECEEFDCLLTLYNVELGVSKVFSTALQYLLTSVLDTKRGCCIHRSTVSRPTGPDSQPEASPNRIEDALGYHIHF